MGHTFGIRVVRGCLRHSREEHTHHVAWKSITESFVFDLSRIVFNCGSELMCVIDMAAFARETDCAREWEKRERRVDGFGGDGVANAWIGARHRCGHASKAPDDHVS